MDLPAELACRRKPRSAAPKSKPSRDLRDGPEIVHEYVPGLAGQTAAGVIAWLPELGRILQAAAALIGAAPYDDDSGGRKAGATSRPDARHPQPPLYAGHGRRHPAQPGAQGLLPAPARQSEAKVALIACMRKLIGILNTMLARDETWDPPAPAAA